MARWLVKLTDEQRWTLLVLGLGMALGILNLLWPRDRPFPGLLIVLPLMAAARCRPQTTGWIAALVVAASFGLSQRQTFAIKASDEAVRLASIALGGALAVVLSVVRVRAERTLLDVADIAHDSQERYRDLFEASPLPMWVVDNESLQFLAVNEATVQHYGYSRKELLRMTAADIRPADEVERFRRTMTEPRTSIRLTRNWRHLTKDGGLLDVEVSTHDIVFDGRPAALVVVNDVTERRKAELQVRRLSAAVEQSPLAIIITDPDGHIEYVNPGFVRMTGYALEDVRGRTPRVLKSGLTPPEAYERLWATIKRGEPWQGALHNRDRSGRLYWQQTAIAPIRDESGAITHFVAVQEDFTARREAEARLRGLFDGVPIGLYRTRLDGAMLEGNPALLAILGFSSREELLRLNARDCYANPADRDRLLDLLRRDGVVRGFATRLKRRDGSEVPVETSATAERDADGHIAFVDGSVVDVTERQSLMAQLGQAQKMEAVGLLAGGIAHDFNNLLGAITVFGELAAGDIPVGDPRRTDLDSIQEAVQRATTLTRQLLTFSRKQVLHPVDLDLNAIIGDVLKILGRLIGEDIELVTNFGRGIGLIRADANQIEQVLLNLAVNARDAMPGGGTLRISTSAAVDGCNVLTVADTGSGMTPEVRERIFEPFFTTKGPRGTGLGLATVYGIVQQAGGSIEVASEPGKGATFTIRLPRVTGEAPAAAAPAPAEETLRGGSETVLLVEDDPGLRLASSTVLRRLGYTVIVARTGEEALGRATDHRGPIHLVISDVVLPGIDGLALVERLRAVRPGIKAVLTSGYAGDAMTQRGVTASGVPFLQKPFASVELARMARAVLDSRPGEGRSLSSLTAVQPPQRDAD